MQTVIDFIVDHISLLVWLISLLLLIRGMRKDIRRFRNCFIAMFHFIALVLFICSMNMDNRFGMILLSLFIIFWIWMMLGVPFLLIYNGFVVIRREGLHIANLLSLFFGIAILAGIYSSVHGLILLINGTATNTEIYFWAVIGSTIFYISFIFVAFLFYSVFTRTIPRSSTYDFIIVLGAGLINGERVTPLLASRCDKAVKVYNRSMSSAKIVCSGGQGSDEKISEARAMKNYILTKGVPDKDIILEDKSVNTIENLSNTKRMLDQNKGRKKIALVTSNYHVQRAMIYSRQVGIQCTGIGSRTALYFWPSAMIREYIALMKYYLPWFLAGLLIIYLLLFMFIKLFALSMIII